MTPRSRVVVYVERGDELLVFDHRDHPDAGTQVPGGGVFHGEVLLDAAVREVYEETGLELRAKPELLGTHAHVDDQDRPTLGHFYRVDAPAEAPDAWEHNVTGHGEDEGLVFLCRFDSAPTLWPVDAVFRSVKEHP